MGLLAHLPLVSNLKNRGYGTVIIGGDDPTFVTTSSKISNGALYINNTQIKLDIPEMVGLEEYSIAFWVNRTDTQTLWKDYFSFDFLNSGQKIRMETYSSSTQGCNIFANGVLTGDGGVSVKTSMPMDEWVHIAVTVSDTKITTYVNGTQSAVLDYSSSYSPAQLSNYLYIGESGIHALYNDLRVYDHCLSNAEVKRIHDTVLFDYEFNTPNGNILKNSGTFNGWSKSAVCSIDNTHTIFGNDSLKISATGNTSSIYSGVSLPLTSENTNINCILRAGDVVTFSAWIYTPSDASIDYGREIRIYQSSNSGGSTIWGPYISGSTETDKWVLWKATYTLREDLAAATLNFNIVRNGTYWISSPKLEYGDQATRWTDTPAAGNILLGTITNSTNGRSVLSSDGQSVTINWTTNAGDTYFYLNSLKPLKCGKTYLLTFDVSGCGNGVKFAFGNRSNYQITLVDGENKYLFTVDEGLCNSMSNNKRFLFDDHARNTSLSNLQIGNFCLIECPNPIDDNSGNGIGLDYNDKSIYIADEQMPKLSSFTNIGMGSILIRTGAEISGMKNSFAYIDTPFSLETWFYRLESGYLKGPFISLTSGNGGMMAYDNSLYLTGANSSMTIDRADISVSDNTWNHLVITYDGTTLKQYLNGVMYNQQDGNIGSIFTSNSEMNTGYGIMDNHLWNYIGYFSRIRLYGTALSEPRIIQLYQAKQKIDNKGTIYGYLNEMDVNQDKATMNFDKKGNINAFRFMENKSSNAKILNETGGYVISPQFKEE